MLFEKLSIRLRLSIAHSFWMSILLVGLSFLFYKIVEKRLYDSVDTALLSSARTIKKTYKLYQMDNSWNEQLFTEMFNSPWNFLTPSDRVIRPFAQIISLSGTIFNKTNNVRVTLPVTPHAVSRAEAGLSTFETFHFKERPPLRQATLPVTYHGNFTGELIQVGASLRQTIDTLKGTALVLWFIIPTIILLSTFLGYVLSRSALKPVVDIAQAARSLGINQLKNRLPVPEAKDEIHTLANTFNSLLKRIHMGVKQIKRFSGDVSHELKTPVSVIRAEAELTLKRERSPEAYKEALKVILKESVHMTDIIENLLLLAKAENKAIEMPIEPLHISELTEELRRELLFEFNKKSVHFDIQVMNNFTFRCSKNHLKMALANILLNAAKHSPMNGTVLFKCESNNSSINFEIQDSGPGIEKSLLPQIFDPFFRVDSARNRKLGGVGIGLSLSKALILLHDGSIHVESTLGEGTTFKVNLPLLG